MSAVAALTRTSDASLVDRVRSDPVLRTRLASLATRRGDRYADGVVMLLAPRGDGVVRVLRRVPRGTGLLAVGVGPGTTVTVRQSDDSSDLDDDDAFDAVLRDGEPLALDGSSRHASTATVAGLFQGHRATDHEEVIAALTSDAPWHPRLWGDDVHLGTLTRVARSLAGQDALSALIAALPPAHAGLARALVGPDPTFEADHAVALGECARLANPTWVGEAVARQPMLRHLFYATGADRPVRRAERRTHLDDLDRGASAAKVVGDVLRRLDGNVVDGPGLHPSTVSSFRATWPNHVHLGERRPNGMPPHERSDLADGRPRPRSTLLATMGEFFAARPKHRPFDGAELAALRGLLDACCGRTWPSAADLARALPCLMDGEGRLAPPPEGLRDVVTSVTASLRSILVPHVGLEGHRVQASASMLAMDAVFPPGRGRAGVARVDAAWHAASPDFERRLADHGDAGVRGGAAVRGVPVPGEVAFPHFLDAPTRLRGVDAVPVRDARALLAEGEEMRHCVGSRHGTARRGAEFVVSLRGRGIRSTASFRLRKVPEGTRLVVGEHRSSSNGDPDPRLVEAAHTLAEAFRADPARLPALLSEVELSGALADVADDPFAHVDEGEARTFREIHFSNVMTVLGRSEASMDVDMWAVTALRRRASEVLPLVPPHESELRAALSAYAEATGTAPSPSP